MNYELAKELKDNGFPQKYKPFAVSTLTKPEKQERVYLPTLSELIEACGENFGELRHYRNDGKWEAQAKDWVDENGWGIFSSGKTPEEAVAKLWLELNK